MGEPTFGPDDVGDGLPLIAPTRARVARLLDVVGSGSRAVLGEVPARNGRLTYEVAAANAVMAGCTPLQFWLVTEAMRSMLAEEFNLLVVQATTHPACPCVIVSGPVAALAGVHGGAGCLGPGWQANAAIGRAIRLILMNVGGARPGELDKATFGTPAKWAYCFSDQSVSTPDGGFWPSIAEEFTGSPLRSTVTVAALDSPRNVNDHFSHTGTGVLHTVASCLGDAGSNDPVHYPNGTPLVLLGPEHAQTVAAGGFSRAAAREYLAAQARVPLRRWSSENRAGRFHETSPDDPTAWALPEVPVATADNIVLAVAGGPGKHSAVAPSLGTCRVITTEVLPPV